jgi:subtilase family serine protease
VQQSVNAPALSPAVLSSVPQSAVSGVAVMVHLPLRNSAELDALIAQQGDKRSPEYHHFLTPEQFQSRYAPSAADEQSVDGALRAAGFQTHVLPQGVLAFAPQSTVEHTFGITLRRHSLARNGGYAQLSASGRPVLPTALTRASATVVFSKFQNQLDSYKAQPDNRYAAWGLYWFDDLKEAYRYPSFQHLNGAGRTIGIVMSAYPQQSDLDLYFENENYQLFAPIPRFEKRPVLGGPTIPFDQNPAALEASLDVQMALGSAPGARVLFYGTPDLSETSALAAYSKIVQENEADIVTSSFGLCELYYTAAYNDGVDYTSLLGAYHDVFRQGNAQGITFVAASGDYGAKGCYDPTATYLVNGVNSPADDPNVTAVGGTNLETASVPNALNSNYVSENAYSDQFNDVNPYTGAPIVSTWGSGGGISTIYSKPWYQNFVPTRSESRTLPDVAMHMGGCPVGTIDVNACATRSSDVTAAGGSLFLLIGTSASSPEFAGLLAVTEQNLNSRLGNANGYIYALAALGGQGVFHDSIPGNNGYPSTPGYNYVLGNGTPKGADFALDPFGPFAGIPQSAGNP